MCDYTSGYCPWGKREGQTLRTGVPTVKRNPPVSREERLWLRKHSTLLLTRHRTVQPRRWCRMPARVHFQRHRLQQLASDRAGTVALGIGAGTRGRDLPRGDAGPRARLRPIERRARRERPVEIKRGLRAQGTQAHAARQIARCGIRLFACSRLRDRSTSSPRSVMRHNRCPRTRWAASRCV